MDLGVSDILERFEESAQEHSKVSEKNKNKMQLELAKAEEMRKTSLETFSETKKRKALMGNDDEKSPKQRKSTTDPFSFLNKKIEQDNEARTEEMNIKNAELEL